MPVPSVGRDRRHGAEPAALAAALTTGAADAPHTRPVMVTTAPGAGPKAHR